MGLDHITIPVADLARAERFYGAVLAPLGMTLIAQDGDAVGFGRSSWVFGVYEAPVAAPLHLAFTASSRTEVEAFHTAGLAAGATCNGPPGLRTQYGAGYFAAYLTCPDGNNVEAVWRG